MAHKKKTTFLPEHELIERFQQGKISWKGYVTMHSPEWKAEFEEFCKKKGRPQDDNAAKDFLDIKDKEIEEGM